ncbi:LOW QUALITY PROTEIN: uncharacterized protein [Amphiura filiformis]|uniref:LOW QUALITY PROTEIN: uncharacterized protein n=1 Tax=Amphiura filiformis TaxID=82378 RepID=UPI003B213577
MVAQDCKGSWAKTQLLKLWQASTYVIRLPHMMGSPTKKLQQTENKLAQVQQQLDAQKVENSELARVNERMKHWKKWGKGGRGRSKGKKNVSKLQKNRRKKKKAENVIETLSLLLGDSVKAITVTIEDEDGKQIEVTVEGDGLKKGMFTQEDIDEMVFIMDSQNIAVRGYHEIAARHSCLPQSYKVNDRRKELNETCNVKETTGRHNGMWQSLEESLTRTLSHPNDRI